MGNLQLLEEGRQAFDRSQWRACLKALARADDTTTLGPEDLWRLGNAAYLLGDEDAAISAWTRAHHGFVDSGENERAARLGFWLSLSLLVAGKRAQSSGWLSRAERLIQEPPECAEHGFLLVVRGLCAMFSGDEAAACAAFGQAIDVAGRQRDPDLLAFGVLGRGQALVQMQQIAEGVALLDEAMVAVVSGNVSPITAGLVYCAVILTCERVYDLERAQEWTLALDEWCRSQPELVAFRGQCLPPETPHASVRWPPRAPGPSS